MSIYLALFLTWGFILIMDLIEGYIFSILECYNFTKYNYLLIGNSGYGKSSILKSIFMQRMLCPCFFCSGMSSSHENSIWKSYETDLTNLIKQCGTSVLYLLDEISPLGLDYIKQETNMRGQYIITSRNAKIKDSLDNSFTSIDLEEIFSDYLKKHEPYIDNILMVVGRNININEYIEFKKQNYNLVLSAELIKHIISNLEDNKIKRGNSSSTSAIVKLHDITYLKSITPNTRKTNQ